MSVQVFIPGDMLSCALGANELAIKLAKEAVARGKKITIIRNGSRGICWAEPLLEVQTQAGRMAYGKVNESDVISLFEAGFLTGGAHKKSLGLTEEIPWLAKQTRVIFNRCGIIDPLCLDGFIAHGGFVGLTKALQMQPDEIIEQVLQSGLRGRGGAGFPTGIKWQTVRQAQGAVKHIVANADEGDSGTFSDRLIMEGDPFRLIEGMIIAAIATGAAHGVIYLRSEYPFAAKTLTQAIKLAKAANWLGQNIQGSGVDFELELFIGAGSYVCGEETALLESLEGNRGMVRSKPPLPALEGLNGQPTVINNVITLCAVPDILDQGGKWHAGLGINLSTGTMPFQLAGNVAKGGLVELPFGVCLHELVDEFGEGTRDGSPVRALQVGGPLGAYLPPELFGAITDYEEFTSLGAGIGHGGIVVYGANIDMREQAKYAFAFCAEESCGKCTPCRIGAVRGKELMEQTTIDTDLVNDLCDVMVQGSACAMGSMTPIPVQSAMRYFPQDFERKT